MMRRWLTALGFCLLAYLTAETLWFRANGRAPTQVSAALTYVVVILNLALITWYVARAARTRIGKN